MGCARTHLVRSANQKHRPHSAVPELRGRNGRRRRPFIRAVQRRAGCRQRSLAGSRDSGQRRWFDSRGKDPDRNRKGGQKSGGRVSGGPPGQDRFACQNGRAAGKKGRIVKLELEISGGLAAPITSSRYTLDVSTLPQDVQKQVEELVKKILAAPRPAPNPQLRDAMSYQLTVTSDTRKESVTADDGALSQPMRELIKLIKASGTRTRQGM